MQRVKHGSSMCFTVAPDGDRWSVGPDGVDERVLTRASTVPEISILAQSFAAYPDTSSEVRSQAPDSRKRLRQLATQVNEELRKGATLSAKTSQAVASALSHVSAAGNHLSGLLNNGKPDGQTNGLDIGGPDGANSPSGYLTGAGYPVDNNAGPSRSVFAADRLKMDRARIERMKLASAEATEAVDLFAEDREAIEDRTEGLAEVLAMKPYVDQYANTHTSWSTKETS